MSGLLLDEVRLFIGSPTNGLVHSDFALCMAMMAHDLSAPLKMVKQHTFRLHYEKGSMLIQQRESIVDAARQARATHLMFVDTDHTFPPQAARVLLSRRLNCVAVNCVTKTFPARATARDEGGPAGKEVPIKVDDSGCRRVWRIGTGIMFLDMKVFEKLGEPPYFGSRWDPERKRHVYEDWIFVEKLQAAGIDVYIDQQLSPLVGHIGFYTYSFLDQEGQANDAGSGDSDSTRQSRATAE